MSPFMDLNVGGT